MWQQFVGGGPCLFMEHRSYPPPNSLWCIYDDYVNRGFSFGLNYANKLEEKSEIYAYVGRNKNGNKLSIHFVVWSGLQSYWGPSKGKKNKTLHQLQGIRTMLPFNHYSGNYCPLYKRENCEPNDATPPTNPFIIGCKSGIPKLRTISLYSKEEMYVYCFIDLDSWFQPLDGLTWLINHEGMRWLATHVHF